MIVSVAEFRELRPVKQDNFFLVLSCHVLLWKIRIYRKLNSFPITHQCLENCWCMTPTFDWSHDIGMSQLIIGYEKLLGSWKRTGTFRAFPEQDKRYWLSLQIAESCSQHPIFFSWISEIADVKILTRRVSGEITTARTNRVHSNIRKLKRGIGFSLLDGGGDRGGLSEIVNVLIAVWEMIMR